MTIYILAALGIWLTQTFLAASFKTVFAAEPTAAVQDHMRGKDRAVELSIQGGRAQRAQQNLLESLVVFLPLALLLEAQGKTSGLATQGALMFVVGRILYVPAYHFAIFGVRTAMWTVAGLGLAMMAYAALT